MKKFIIIAAVLIAIAAGIYFFKGGKDGGLSLDINIGDNEVLAYVPADTIFFTGSLEPISFEKAMAMSQKMGMDPSAFMMMDSDSLEINADAPDALRFLLGFYGKYMQGFADNNLTKSMGVNNDLNAAAYMVGAIPVMRVELDGTETFANLVASIESEHNVTPVVKSMDSVEYREYSFNAKDKEVPYQLVVSIKDNQAVITINTPIADDKDLKAALGVEKPAKSIADTDVLSKMVSANGYQPHSLFFFDNLATVKGITNPAANSFGAMVQELLVAHGSADSLAEYQTPACQTEFAAMAANWPTINAGYTDFSEGKANFKMVIEGTNTELLNTLAKLRGHLSDNLNNDQFMMSFGMGFNMDELVPVITDVWKRLTKEPYECPALANMQAGLKQQNPMMLGMMTGMLSGIKGIGFGIVDMDMSNLANAENNPNPMAFTENMEMVLTVSAEEPTNLLQTLGMYAPEMAQLQLTDGGEAQSLNSPMGGESEIALRGHDLVLMMGSKANSALSNMSSNKNLDSNGLISFNMDFGKYMGMIEQMMSGINTSAEMSDEQKKIIEQQKEVFAKLKQVKGDIKQSFDINQSGFVSNTAFEAK
ncbi:MAG: hypothetical protein HWD86_11135 [Kangiellaceae bacterium]|nr:hypothetical protein [Kangiellaceae bacterium]